MSITKLDCMELKDTRYSVYPYDGYNLEEILGKFYEAIKECNDLSFSLQEFNTWLIDEGLIEEVEKQLIKVDWDKVINSDVYQLIVNRLGEVNNKVSINTDNINTINNELVNKANKVDLDIASKELEYIKNNLNYINKGETIQEAINRVSINGGVLRLENKTYNLTKPLIIDISKVSIDGNGATFDFSQAPTNCECIKLISNANTPYLNNGNFIKSLEIVGKGKEYNQVAIIFDSDLEARATSHLDFEKLNIHDFGNGINLKRYCYLLRFYSVDIYNCKVCVDMPADGADAGENFCFFGCAMYNSDIALRCNNVNGSFHFTSCSIDYVSYAFDLVSSAKATFINGHIEGGCKIKGSVNIIGSWLVYTDAENMFEGNETTKINIDKCFINTSTINKVLTNGLVKVKFSDCRYLDIDNFSTNKLNSTSSSVDAKYIDLYAVGGTSTNTDKLTMGNCTISVDTENQETGDRCYKIVKEYGVGSYSTFRLLIPRNKSCSKVNLNVRLKANKNLNGIDVSLSTVNIMGYDVNGVPYWTANKVSGSVTLSLTSSYTTFTMYNNTNIITNNDNYYAIDFNLFNCDSPIVYIDSVQLYEY